MLISLQLFGVDLLNFFIGQPPSTGQEGVYVQNVGGNYEIAPEEVEYVYEEDDEAKFGFH